MVAQWWWHWCRIDLGLGCERGLSLAAFSKSDLTCHRFPEWVWSVVTVQHMITGFPTRCFRKVWKCLGEKNHNTSLSLSLFPLNVNTSHLLFSYLLRAAEICCAPKLLTLNEELVTESKWGLFSKHWKEPSDAPDFLVQDSSSSLHNSSKAFRSQTGPKQSDRPEFQSYLHHELALWSLANYFTALASNSLFMRCK